MMSTASEYFNKMVTTDMEENRKGYVCFDYDDNCLIHLIDYVYTGNIEITPKNIAVYVDMADYLQVGLSEPSRSLT